MKTILGNSLVLVVAVVVALTDVVRSTHFRGGSMTWHAKEGENGMQFEIAYKLAYQIDTTEGYDNRCTKERVRNQVTVDGDYKKIKVQYPDGTAVDGVTSPRTTYVCIERHEAADYARDKSNSWIIGENKQEVAIPNDLLQFQFLWHSCCWVDMNNYQEPKDWDFMMTVDLRPRADTGAINSPPHTTGIPVKVLSTGCEKTNITIPTSDEDGDVVRCRWVNHRLGECNGNCPRNSKAYPIIWKLENTHEGCRLVVTPSQSAPGWYGVPIMLEDFSGSSTGALSRVPFQFMLKIVDRDTCPKPEIVSPPDMCRELSVGEEHSITLVARAVTRGTSIRDIMTSGIMGMHKSDIEPVPGRPDEYYVIVTWTPPMSQQGRSSMLCFQPEDSEGFQGEMHCIQLYVGESSPPVPDPVESVPSQGSKIHYSQTTFLIIFDSRIKRPSSRSQIRFLDAADGSLVHSVPVETTSADTSVVYYRDVILVAIPAGVLEVGRTYTIDLPEGLAKGLEGCGKPSQAASWDFRVVGGSPGNPDPPRKRVPFQLECYPTYMQIFIPKLIVPGEEPTQVYFREPTCVAQTHNATHFLMRTDYQFCGTKIEHEDDNVALAKNDLHIVGPTVPESQGATRNSGNLIHLVCRVSNDHTTFVSMDTDIPILAEDTLEAATAYNFTLRAYEDSTYSTPYGYSTYPLHVPLGEKLYFEAKLKRDTKRGTSIYLRSCVATPSPNPGDRLSYQFIENGCPLDDSVDLISTSQPKTVKRFSIESFAFQRHFLSDSIAVYCDVQYVRTYTIEPCLGQESWQSNDVDEDLFGLTDLIV